MNVLSREYYQPCHNTLCIAQIELISSSSVYLRENSHEKTRHNRKRWLISVYGHIFWQTTKKRDTYKLLFCPVHRVGPLASLICCHY